MTRKEREEQIIKMVKAASDSDLRMVWVFVEKYLKKYLSNTRQAQ